ncbi:MAG: response regulator transcription factor [Mariprofundaceae bacterium]|nr:response regulator transcription factor [Mariprofundaceae bacterium]
MTILLADDHGLYRESIKQWLETSGHDYDIDTVANHDQVRAYLASGQQPKLVMMDLCMPGMDGIDSVRSLHSNWPDIPILVVSANEDPAAIRACIEAGAIGFVPKSGNGEKMLGAIQDILAGNSAIPSGAMSARVPQFTEKQQKILRLLAESCSNREIAERARLTEGTVKQYVRDILSKLDVDNRVQAGIRAREILGLNS